MIPGSTIFYFYSGEPGGTFPTNKNVYQRLFNIWASVADGGPKLNRRWVNLVCLLGRVRG